LPKLQGERVLSQRESLALDFAVRLATEYDSIDDASIEGLSREFTPAEIIELGLVIGAFIMLGRLHRAFGIAPMTAATHAALEGAEPNG
jgi:alkylhydroperoxidase family enzyme